MRTINRYELKEGENRVSVSASETDDTEKVERPFLVIRDGAGIKEGMMLRWLGVAVMTDGKAYHISEIL